mgnify:CR=1 FL=1
MWIKNSNGDKDAMLTFATISFAIVSLNILLSTIQEMSVGSGVFSFQTMDSGTMTAYLAATFGAYVSRRWTRAKYQTPSLETQDAPEES